MKMISCKKQRSSKGEGYFEWKLINLALICWELVGWDLIQVGINRIGN